MAQATLSEKQERLSLHTVWEKYGSVLITAGCLLFIALAWIVGRQNWAAAEIILYVLAYVVGGYRKAIEGLGTLFKEKDLDVDLLMVVAAVGAASIGYWMDGAILIFIFCLSGTLEELTMEKTNQDIQSIMKLRPEEAVVLQGGAERKIKAEQLQLGDMVLVRPGERLPADGQVVEGYSAIDQASITGESLPVDKSAGDEVFAGTINGQGALKIKVTKLAEETLLSRIIHLVQEAKNEMPPSQLFVERFEGIYAKMVVALAVLLMTLPPFILDWSWDRTIYRAMIFLVVASPCALVSSIMPAILSGISNAARKGVLFKGGVHLEHIGHVATVAFDKTGTLTEGKPKLSDVVPLSGHTEDSLLQLTASLENLSEHPIAKAIVGQAKERGLVLEAAQELTAIPGGGISGSVGDARYKVGKIGLLHVQSLAEREAAIAAKLEAEGKTVIYVEAGQKLIGLLAIQDVVRPNAKEAVTALKQIGIQVVMLTGDRAATAQAIGAHLGVDAVYADLLPEDKVNLVKKLGERGKVAMIGDGVNDAPALAASSVGIAMGAAGTDVALETANVVLMADDLSKIPYAITLGRRTTRVIKQNLTLAIGVVLLLVATNFLGEINLPSGVVGHEGSTLLVILSGLRLLR
ncbi:heavy metal translocating P-type ATPase [Paenibacillus sp. NFR01]|uniref:heavy metal translocating P-type ATPase n=1 Tax=Paenibacillus sp. NFR01 TaxID=1566279 RepID=UPI0008C08111|nr:heavy metal translocating P-type ATPase [Paenibacillus sp. NFR01]SET22933.1 Cd2+/Zn2+-exporting ATPase [Paenibacillus sp. NFR01]